MRTGADLDATAGPAVALDQPDAAAAIRAHAPDGVDRVVEVPFSDNADLDAAVVKDLGIIAAYPTRDDRPGFPFWPMLFDNVTIRLLGRDDFPASAEQQAAADLTAAARDGALAIPVGPPLPLDRAAGAYDRIDAGSRERVLLTIPDGQRSYAASMDPESRRPSTRDWLVRSAVLVVAVSVTAAVVFPSVGLGSWLHAGLLAAAVAVTGAAFTRAATGS